MINDSGKKMSHRNQAENAGEKFYTENENNAAHPDLQLRTAALFSWYVIERILEPSGRTSAY